MATVTVDVPDAYAVEVANAVWALFPPFPELSITKAQNVQRVLRWHLKQAVMETRRRAAQEASNAALVQVETDFA